MITSVQPCLALDYDLATVRNLSALFTIVAPGLDWTGLDVDDEERERAEKKEIFITRQSQSESIISSRLDKRAATLPHR